MHNPRHISADEIYDAIFDSEGLALLPGRLAEAFGGRSALIQWHHSDGSVQVLAHCGYFSDQQMMTYAAEFAAVDPWAIAAAERQPVNSTINLEDLVGAKAYEKTVFYNEFIRSIGDDTCRGMGARVQTVWGAGTVAVQRGRSQNRFERSNIAALDECAGHLRRMLSIRGRFSVMERENLTLQGMLDGMAHAALLVTGEGRLLHMNAAAEGFMLHAQLLAYSNGRIEAAGAAMKQLRLALAAAVAPSPTAGAVVLGQQVGRPVIATVSPMRLPNGSRAAMLLLEVSHGTDQMLTGRLRALFGLTGAEAEVAAGIGNGMSLAEIAETRRVAVSTVRAQLKQIVSKTGCNRQSQIVSLIRSVVPG